MEEVHHTAQAGPQVEAAVSTQAFHLVAAVDIILDFQEEALRPFLEAFQILECLPHVVHQLEEDVGPAV